MSLFRARQDEDTFIALSPTMWINRGLDESVIRDIPTFQFKREGFLGRIILLKNAVTEAGDHYFHSETAKGPEMRNYVAAAAEEQRK
ncbi:hypothetical protein CCACVL1_14370 [Corchorus capsularis]|uniref:Uncharacterized protein n=1 Tax=Corchorus capsularis TaxID=210143 RepID=A0A1R3I796_COCAP|nr:hypothetical protein CCACVL1_14370 [Corchorus capsularis]